MSSAGSDVAMRQKRSGVPGYAMQQGARRKNLKVFVGLSGGVDSSVAALLLKEQGYEVVGVYMKNWSRDLPGMPCPWKEDFNDAKRVAVQLGIDFKVYDFEKQYHQKVVNYMLDGYKSGFTPNPDIMCNQEIKFKLFLQTALEDGADYIATGHYARVKSGKLLAAKDENKDQTYFLHRVSSGAFSKTLFPLGGLTKPKVRKLASQAGLITSDKKESMGICFVSNVSIKDFLSQYVSEKPGDVINQQGEIVGEHDGAIFYTIGQRHGLNVGGGLPYYVAGKSIKKNEVYVTTNLQDQKLWSNKFRLSSTHWINNQPEPGDKISVRIRHRAPLIPVKLLISVKAPRLDLSSEATKILKSRERYKSSNSQWEAELQDDVRALTPGQSAVFYSGSEVLGGGIVV